MSSRGVSPRDPERPSRLGLEQLQAVGGGTAHDRPDRLGGERPVEVGAQRERALDELLPSARNRAEAPDDLRLQRVEVSAAIRAQSPEEGVRGKVLQDLVEHRAIPVDELAVVTRPSDIQGGDEAMDAVRRRDESALGPDLAGVLGDGERLVPPPEERQGVRPPGSGVEPPPVHLPGLKQTQRRGGRAVRLGEVAQQGRGPRHHRVGVESFVEIEAVLEGETLLGELSGLRPRPARLRAAGECVERGAAEPGIVEAVGDRQAASRARLGLGDVRAPSPAPLARTDRTRPRSGSSRWPARHGPGTSERPAVRAESLDLLLGRPVPHRPLKAHVPGEETAQDAQLLVDRPAQLPAEPERDPVRLRPGVSPGHVTEALLELREIVGRRQLDGRAQVPGRFGGRGAGRRDVGRALEPAHRLSPDLDHVELRGLGRARERGGLAKVIGDQLGERILSPAGARPRAGGRRPRAGPPALREAASDRPPPGSGCGGRRSCLRPRAG